MNTVEVGLSLFLAVRVAGCRDRRMSRELYLLSLETVGRNSSALVRE